MSKEKINNASTLASKKLSRWEIADILFKAIGSILLPLAILFLGYIVEKSSESARQDNAKVQLYTELMSNREETESVLRKDMFKAIASSFFDNANYNYEQKLLNMELLTYNFHESFDLKPLFVHLRDEFLEVKELPHNSYIERLENLAKTISKKQLPLLESVGKKIDGQFDFEELAQFISSENLLIENENTLNLEGITRTFTIKPIEVNYITKEVKISLKIETETDISANKSTKIIELWISFFDFPSMNNIRLSNDQRCAVVLNSLSEKYQAADYTMVYFPGSYSSLREKPYYEEVVRQYYKLTHE